MEKYIGDYALGSKISNCKSVKLSEKLFSGYEEKASQIEASTQAPVSFLFPTALFTAALMSPGYL